jgi:hypothetical protein
MKEQSERKVASESCFDFCGFGGLGCTQVSLARTRSPFSSTKASQSVSHEELISKKPASHESVILSRCTQSTEQVHSIYPEQVHSICFRA